MPDVVVPSLDEAQDLIMSHYIDPSDIGTVMAGLQGTYMPGSPTTETNGVALLRMAAGLLRDDVRCFWRISRTRPVMSPYLQEVARPFWQEKWDQHKADPCPVCFAERGDNVVWDGPMNSAYPTRCNHWLCTACWQNLVDHTPGAVRCPVCREDVTDWAMGHYEAEE